MPDGSQLFIPPGYRDALIRAETFDDKARTVELVFTTGALVRRRRFYDDDFDEELVVSAAAVRLARLKAGAPFLNSHRATDLSAVIGIVTDARIANGQGLATVRFSVRDDVQPLVADIRAGVIKNVSVGYRVHKFEIEKRDGQPELWRATDWEPLEISAVAIGADPLAQIRADEPQELYSFKKIYVSRPGEPGKRKVAKMSETQLDPSPDEIRVEERKRAAGILDTCRRHQLGEAFAERLLNSSLSLQDARNAALDEIARRDNLTAGISEISLRGMLGDDAGPQAMAAAILARISPKYRDELAKNPAARAFANLSLTEMVRQNLGASGQRGDFNKNQLADIAIRGGGVGYGAQTTSDFAAALEMSARRVLQDAYQAAEPGARLLARETQFTDFRPQRSIAGGAFPQLLKVPEGAEVKNGALDLSGEDIVAATYARIAALTRQAIINDDVGAFADMTRLAAEAAIATEQILIAGVIEANPKLRDGEDVFSAAHGNLAASGAVISEATLSTAVAAIRNQVGVSKERIALTPRFLLVPTNIETAARKAVAAVNPTSTAEANIFQGLQVIVEPRLVSQTAWYLVAGSGDMPAVGLARGYIGGQGPEVVTQQGFRFEGVEVKCRIDFGTGWQDFRSWYKNPGA